jgi:hypothetical protein
MRISKVIVTQMNLMKSWDCCCGCCNRSTAILNGCRSKIHNLLRQFYVVIVDDVFVVVVVAVVVVVVNSDSGFLTYLNTLVHQKERKER